MSVYVVTFIASFCFVVGSFSFLSDDKKIKAEHCLIGIGMGIFGAAIVGISFQGIENANNDLKQQTIQKDTYNDKN